MWSKPPAEPQMADSSQRAIPHSGQGCAHAGVVVAPLHWDVDFVQWHIREERRRERMERLDAP